MKTRFLGILLALGLIVTACNTIQIRTDPDPAPVDQSIMQQRLEFSGCSVQSQIGTIACLPGDVANIVTEFAGDVIYFSAAQNCSLMQQVRATPPMTQLKLPTANQICDVTVLYVPEYIPAGQPTTQIYGISGEVSMQPDASYTPQGNFAITVDQTLTLTFPGAQRGVFISRQTKDPVDFAGDTLTFKPVAIGTDLLQLKLFMPDGSVQKKLITGNYYSESALALLFDVQTTSKSTTLQFPPEVSVVTMTGKKPTSQLTITVAATFTGYVRAYTVKGRTVVAYFENGALLWSH